MTHQRPGGEPQRQCERCGRHPGGSWFGALQQDRPPTDHTPSSGGASGGFGG